MSKYLYLLLAFSFFTQPLAAVEDVPDDVRYMLEDMYGANKKIGRHLKVK